MLRFLYYLNYLLYRFGFVEEELNEFWRITIEEARHQRTKKERKQKKRKISRSVELNVGNADSILRQTKEPQIQNKDTSLPQTANPRGTTAESNTKSDVSKELEDAIIDAISFESPIPITNIVPEILKNQFFKKKSYNPSDCLLEKCKQLLRRYKKLRKDELLQTEHNTNSTITNINKEQVTKHGVKFLNEGHLFK